MHSFQHIQGEFNERYPFLRIDFIRLLIGEEKPLPSRQRAEGAIDIEGYRTVDQVIKDFKEIFGLSMKVLRRSGKLWIETSLTADWTLEQQNREGENISRIA
jgi:hypothetical protein